MARSPGQAPLSEIATCEYSTSNAEEPRVAAWANLYGLIIGTARSGS